MPISSYITKNNVLHGRQLANKVKQVRQHLPKHSIAGKAQAPKVVCDPVLIEKLKVALKELGDRMIQKHQIRPSKFEQFIVKITNCFGKK